MNAGATELGSDRLAERRDVGLRGGVGGAAAQWLVTGEASDVEDSAAAGRDHCRESRSGESHDGEDVEPDLVQLRVDRQSVEGAARANPRVVHQQLDRVRLQSL